MSSEWDGSKVVEFWIDLHISLSPSWISARSCYADFCIYYVVHDFIVFITLKSRISLLGCPSWARSAFSLPPEDRRCSSRGSSWCWSWWSSESVCGSHGRLTHKTRHTWLYCRWHWVLDKRILISHSDGTTQTTYKALYFDVRRYIFQRLCNQCQHCLGCLRKAINFISSVMNRNNRDVVKPTDVTMFKSQIWRGRWRLSSPDDATAISQPLKETTSYEIFFVARQAKSQSTSICMAA